MTEEPESRPSRRLVLVLTGAAILVAAFLGGRMIAPLVRSTPPSDAPAVASPAPAPQPSAAPAPSTPEPVAETPVEEKARPRKKAAPPATPAVTAPAAPTAGELRIDSDVPGAMVFLDRKFLGNAPVTAHDVTPGPHQVNASADGYDGISETIDVAVGPADVTLRFKEIRLKEAVDVVHKHGMGSCEGRLLADPQGVRYETSHKEDAFNLRFAEIETFEVDYLKKSLKLKKRGGKTWNFTTKHENADPLFVFHRGVDKVRKQVAK